MPAESSNTPAASTDRFPQRAARWRVIWCDWRDYHDWIGRHSQRGKKTSRKSPPPQQRREFFTREAAENFAATLRRDFGDEIVLQTIDITQLLPPAPEQQSFATAWPLQRRID